MALIIELNYIWIHNHQVRGSRRAVNWSFYIYFKLNKFEIELIVLDFSYDSVSP